MVQEIQQQLVGPVQVLHDQHGRTPLGQRLAEPPPGREGLVLAVAGVLGRAGQADQRVQVPAHPGRLALVGDQVTDGPLQLGLRLVGRVGVQDPGLGLDDLAQRPQGHPLAVGQAAALPPGGQLGLGIHQLLELPDQAALADPGHPDQGDELHRLLVAGPGQRRPQQLDLALAADQHGPARLVDLHPEARSGGERHPGRDRLGLALGRDGRGRLVADGAVGGPPGRLVDQDPVHRGRRLEPRRRVDDIPRGHPLALDRTGVQEDQGLAGGHADPDLQSQCGVSLVQLGDRLPDGEGGPDRPLGVVLVGHRRAEQGHHGVADELLHRSPEAFQVGPEALVVGGEHTSDVLDVQALGPAGEADQVAEQHADPLALLPAGGGRGGQRRRAGQAEPGPLGVVLAAATADRHDRIVAEAATGRAGTGPRPGRRPCRRRRRPRPPPRRPGRRGSR
jgi:hypothetical protein